MTIDFSNHPIHESWAPALKSGLAAAPGLQAFLDGQDGATIYPAAENVFAALNATPLPAVKVVIVGQDPYHGPGQAHGLSFSVQRGITKPPSLRNIFRELADDLGIAEPSHGCLSAWADRGVLLLNSVLTVAAGNPGSHAGRGWEQVTDRMVTAVAERSDPAAFLLWGAYAQAKGAMIDENRHLVIRSAHPSPFAARKGFFGSKPFSRVNAWLAAQGKTPIDWTIH